MFTPPFSFTHSLTHPPSNILIQSFVLNSLLHLKFVIVSDDFASQFGWIIVCRSVWQRHLRNGCIAHIPRPMLPLCLLLPAVIYHSSWEFPEYTVVGRFLPQPEDLNWLYCPHTRTKVLAVSAIGQHCYSGYLH